MIFGLYLFVLALMLLHPIEAFAPDLAEYRPLLLLSLAVFAAAAFTGIRSGRIAAAPRHLVLFGAFVVVLGISRAVNGWTGGAIVALTDFGPTAVLFATTLLLVTTTQRLKITGALIAGCMTLLAIAGIAAVHTGFMADQLLVHEGVEIDDHFQAADSSADDDDEDEAPERTLWRVRSWGFLSDPNDFSQAMVATLPMLAALWMRRRRLRNLAYVWIPGALLIYAIYLTHSRGALLGLAAVFGFALLRRAGYFRTGIVLGAIAAGAVVVGFTGGRSISSEDESAGGRIEAWSEGIAMLRSDPVFGIGYGNFTDNFELTAHNSFVLCFAELGLVGYFAWLAMIVLSLRETRLASATGPPDADEARWSRALRISMIGFLVCAWFLSRTYQPVLFLLIALCIAISYCAHRTAAPDDAGWPAPARWPSTTVKLMLASIVLIYLIVRLQNVLLR
ncbi:MAG TPA: O-antigen ligase family protein [Rhodanobacteraceae bacterium]|nr:O-antigen ligase family protein [Rhodanobacteraceae bacterium]